MTKFRVVIFQTDANPINAFLSVASFIAAKEQRRDSLLAPLDSDSIPLWLKSGQAEVAPEDLDVVPVVDLEHDAA